MSELLDAAVAALTAEREQILVWREQADADLGKIEAALAALGRYPTGPAPPEPRAPVDDARTCTLCPRIFQTSGERKRHEADDHHANAVKCEHDGQVFGTLGGYKRHERRQHPPEALPALSNRGSFDQGPPDTFPDLVTRVDPDLDGDVPITLKVLAGPEAQTIWTTGDPMLGCSTCLWAHSDAEAIDDHARRNHGRRATRTERTPMNQAEQHARLDMIGVAL